MKAPIEILAPVGDDTMLRAAVYSGADAVYLGVEGFNARRGAANFGPETLAEAVAFAHARGCAVYAAINTVVLPGQEAALDAAIAAARDARCDAAIVQDLYTAQRVQQLARGMQLHGSTQMSVYSLAGVKKLAALGFSRVVLARELSFEEIAAIAKESPIELEVFVHGALCVCVSGQCYMSAFLGGRSANRGACAGPCRLPFRAQKAGGKNLPAEGTADLSLKDLSILEELPRLAAMGVVSAKIEGRLRGPEYCAVVVDAARKAREGQPYDKKLLQDVFSRSGFTAGWPEGTREADMFGVRTAADTAALKKALPAARELYRRERPRVAVEMTLEAGEAGGMLTVADGDGNLVEKTLAGPFAAAEKDPAPALEKALGKTGGTPFYVDEVSIEADGRFVPGPVVNEARRLALEELLEKRRHLPPAWEPRSELARLEPPVGKGERGTLRLRARFASVAQMPEDVGALCAEVTLPLEEAGQVPEVLRPVTWLALPRAAFGLEADVAGQIEEAAGLGFAGFEAPDLGALALCAGGRVRAGFGLNVTNAGTLRLLAALGCEAATLSPELSAEEIKRLVEMAGDVAIGTDILCYGHLPLMVTRAPVGAKVQGAAELIDRKGARFALAARGDVTEIHNPVPLWLAERLAGLPVDSATLWFTAEGAGRAAGVLKAFRQGDAAKGAFTRGLFEKGTK